MVRTFALTAALGMCLTAGVCAQSEQEAKSLSIGDKAPAIEISHWVKGEPVKKFETDKVYVLEFWATWCGPCRASMPHISSLQAEYKDYDVTVIGVSDEPLETVVKFLCKMDPKAEKLWYDKIGYTLTTDPDKSVKNAYFTAAGQTGIPCSFIIGKDGHVEWIGHPMGMDEPLSAVVKDSWDREAFKQKFDREQSAKNAMRRSGSKLRTAMQNEDWDAAIKILDRMIKENPDNPAMLLQKFNVLLLEANRPAAAYDAGEQLVEASWDNAGLLNQVAWTVVDNEAVTRRNLDFAMKAAKRATELTESKDAAILDTLARVYYEMGNLRKAIAWQKKAVGVAGDDQMGESIREILAKYEAEAGR